MRPGPNQTTTTATPPNTAPVNTGTWFPVGYSGQGPETPVLVTSFGQYTKVFGTRGAEWSNLYDWMETYFNEGGSRAWVSRATLSTAKPAFVEFEDGAAGKAIKVEAIGKGTWANTYKCVVTSVAGEEYTIKIQNPSGETLEQSPVLTGSIQAEEWNAAQFNAQTGATPIVKITKLASAKAPKAETKELKVTQAGTDGAPAAADFEAGAKRYSAAMGPGQLSFVGTQAKAVMESGFKIAFEQNRRLVWDLEKNASKATLATEAAAARAVGANAKYGALFASWQNVGPPLNAVSLRAIGPSAFVAAKIAQNDAGTAAGGPGNPNQSPAGRWGILPNSLGQISGLGVSVSTAFTEVEVEELYEKGVNVSKNVNGQIRLYGNATPVNKETEPLYVQFSNVRLDMAVMWEALNIQEYYEFSQLDGQGNDIAAYGNDLKAMLLKYYKIGALFGETPQQAFFVESGPALNTPKTEEEGDLLAVIAMRRSKNADQVNLNIVRVGITQEV